MNNYSMGAVRNEKDLRDIQIAEVQSPITLPDKFITDISSIPVFNQQQLGACVGHAHALVHIYNELKEKGTVEKLSPRYLYALAKAIDGQPTMQGTQPRLVAGIDCNKGDCHEGFCFNNTSLPHDQYINISETPDMDVDASQYKTGGYVFVPADENSLKQAIVQNGLVPITFSVGGFTNPIPRGNLGFHRVTVYGYDGDRFFYRNSWGQEWGDNGNGYFDWGQQDMWDAMAFTDIPDPIIQKAKTGYKYFSPKTDPLMVGVSPVLMTLLDKIRGMAGLPITITSGLRTPQQNADVGGEPNSAHLRGLAIDISVTNRTRQRLLNAITGCGSPVFLEDCPDHLHIDIDSSIHTLGDAIVSQKG